tara:strand:- start:2975 stop:3409 length:435 start_codon:yes stop_codon:yes gene_type:complete
MVNDDERAYLLRVLHIVWGHRNISVYEDSLHKTLREVAHIHMISLERVRQIKFEVAGRLAFYHEHLTDGGAYGKPPEEVHIALLELSVRSKKWLRNAGIYTLADLLAIPPSQCARIPNLGRKSLNELKQVVASLGHTWIENGAK